MIRVLVLLGKRPWPINSGDALRSDALIRILVGAGMEVDVVALPQGGNSTHAPRQQPMQLVRDVQVGRPIGEYLRSRSNRLCTILGRPYQLSVGRDRALRQAVRGVWEEGAYDLAIVGGTYILGALPAGALERVILDTHNVEHLRLQQLFERRNFILRLLGKWLAFRAGRYEAFALQHCVKVFACSDVDSAALRVLAPNSNILTVPNGVWVPVSAPDASEGASGPLVFLSSLDYSANIDALSFFLREILPVLNPDLKVVVGGSNPTAEVYSLVGSVADRVTFLGPVDEASSVRRGAVALVVPLRLGSGTRLKIIEAMGEGVPVISTAKGFEGLDLVPGRHLLQAETPAQFAAAVATLRDDIELRSEIVANARDIVLTRYSWDVLSDSIVESVRVAVLDG